MMKKNLLENYSLTASSLSSYSVLCIVLVRDAVREGFEGLILIFLVVFKIKIPKIPPVHSPHLIEKFLATLPVPIFSSLSCIVWDIIILMKISFDIWHINKFFLEGACMIFLTLYRHFSLLYPQTSLNTYFRILMWMLFHLMWQWRKA